MKLPPKLVSCLLPLITLVTLTADAVASCPSTQQGPPCQEYWQAEAVFIGVPNRVVHTPDKAAPDEWMYVRTTVYFTVEEAFRGIEAGALVLNLDSCGYPFKEGERYLVYAYRYDGSKKEVDVRIGNTRTRPVSEAAEDLNYIRGLSSGERGSRVFGKVVHSGFNFKDGSFKAEPLPDITVTLVANNRRLEVVTDREGRYEFERVPAGTYRLGGEIPSNLNYDEVPISLTGRECVPANISASSKGLIKGRVFDVNKMPLVAVPVSLVSADATLEEILAEGKNKIVGVLSSSDREGRFRFEGLPPGRYFLIINRSESEKKSGSLISRALPRLFYPRTSDLGGATVIVLGKEYQPEDYDFHLPVQ